MEIIDFIEKTGDVITYEATETGNGTMDNVLIRFMIEDSKLGINKEEEPIEEVYTRGEDQN